MSDVKKELRPIAHRWKHIAKILGLFPSQVEIIEAENENIYLDGYLTKVVTRWLKKLYNVESFPEPSWKTLASAVGHADGGNNPALAMGIIKRHKGMPI